MGPMMMGGGMGMNPMMMGGKCVVQWFPWRPNSELDNKNRNLKMTTHHSFLFLFFLRVQVVA